MTGHHDPEVFHTTNRRLQKPRDGSGARSTAPLAIKPRVASSRATPLVDKGLQEGIGTGTGDSGVELRKGMRYPTLNTSTTHGSAPLSLQARQWRDRPPPVRVREGDGSYFRKPEGLEEGADPLPPRKRLRPPEREEEERALTGRTATTRRTRRVRIHKRR